MHELVAASTASAGRASVVARLFCFSASRAHCAPMLRRLLLTALLAPPAACCRELSRYHSSVKFSLSNDAPAAGGPIEITFDYLDQAPCRCGRAGRVSPVTVIASSVVAAAAFGTMASCGNVPTAREGRSPRRRRFPLPSRLRWPLFGAGRSRYSPSACSGCGH